MSRFRTDDLRRRPADASRDLTPVRLPRSRRSSAASRLRLTVGLPDRAISPSPITGAAHENSVSLKRA
jgi:hypothetical protein